MVKTLDIVYKMSYSVVSEETDGRQNKETEMVITFDAHTANHIVIDTRTGNTLFASRTHLDNQLRIERETLTWQQQTDQGYEAITATLERIRNLNGRIDMMLPNRPSSYATNWR